MRSIRALLTNIVDYAGLFPPARLDMAPAVHNYAEYRHAEHAWMLGRFVVPVSRLDEFEHAAADLLPRDEDAEPWRLSALAADDLAPALERVGKFNEEHTEASNGLALIDSLELKADTPAKIENAVRRVPAAIQAFFEIPLEQDVRGLVAALAGEENVAAKMRTGGVEPAMIPGPEPVARFILACAAANVAFKATAGLHHPIRAEQPLTYDEQPTRAVMHGFLNVFLTAALAGATLLTLEEAVALLEQTSPEAFTFDDSGASCADRRLTLDQIDRARREFALSFGSCSFQEPVDDLRALSLL
jgi:hypothetical protein